MTFFERQVYIRQWSNRNFYVGVSPIHSTVMWSPSPSIKEADLSSIGVVAVVSTKTDTNSGNRVFDPRFGVSFRANDRDGLCPIPVACLVLEEFVGSIPTPDLWKNKNATNVEKLLQ